MPKAYAQVHDRFNVEQVGPWLHNTNSVVDPDLPDLKYPSLNPIVQTLDRKRIGCAPKHVESLFDITAQHLVVHRDGSMARVR
jgi:hypothetical protein